MMYRKWSWEEKESGGGSGSSKKTTISAIRKLESLYKFLHTNQPARLLNCLWGLLKQNQPSSSCIVIQNQLCRKTWDPVTQTRIGHNKMHVLFRSAVQEYGQDKNKSWQK